MFRTAYAKDAASQGAEITFDEAKRLLSLPSGELRPDATIWIDVSRPSQEEISELEQLFRLHPLTVEDFVHKNQRAKIEEYPDYLFVVMHWFKPDAPPDDDPVELHCVLGKNFLVTVNDPCELEPVNAAWKRFISTSPLPRSGFGADSALYRVLDELVDGHRPRVEKLEEQLEALNEQISVGEEDPTLVRALVELRRVIVRFRRVVSAERDVLSALSRRDYPLVQAKTVLYFRDVSDHLNRTFEALDALREHCELITEVHLAFAEARRSAVVKRLTVISTIFLPLNFVAGFFGMNFTHIPFDNTALMVLAFSSMVVLPGALLVWMATKRYV